MATSTLQTTVFVHPDTEIRARVRHDRAVGYIATVDWDGLMVFFAPHVDDDEVAGTVAACDRLIAALNEVRASLRYAMEERDREAELERRDDRIDAGLPTGYIGDPA